ncbi:glycoside hydrolase family 88/105 protein [Rufibacter tibetensis]|nr:glycoside hydrolase family 88 protein [Rufibacter tibetensis]
MIKSPENTNKNLNRSVLFLIVMFMLSSWTSLSSLEGPRSLKWSERMALSVLKRNPWMTELPGNTSWGYTQGLIYYSFEKLSHESSNGRYQQLVQQYADKMIDEKGTIKSYRTDAFNIDNINSGKILFGLYESTKDEKYRLAIEGLRNQLRWQPRTTEGGYWHKLKYPWQMWLDGAYMGAPFLAQYAKVFNEPKGFDDVAQQLILMEKHLRDSKTGLLYHGWDESRVQDWADPQTGRSRNFWGRAIGWYAMAIVDVLDYFPPQHPKRGELVQILQRLSVALQTYQDKKTGLWYQVVDQGGREGNYLEGSASSMFVYALAKGVNKGYLDKQFKKVAERGYKGILDHLIEVKKDGEISIHQVCEVAGLGDGRDGSYAYYINESKRTDDPKATGPFILASLELKK